MRCQDEHWAELVVGRALDALEPVDDAALEAHLAECDDCQALLAEMQHVSATLAYAVEEAEPPAELLDHIRAALPARVAVPASVISFEAARQRRFRIGPGHARRVVASLAAASVAAAFVVTGAYAVRVNRDRNEARQSLTAEGSVIRELQSPSAYRVALSSGGPAGGFAVVDGRSVALVVDNLDHNDTSTSIYVLWAAAYPGAAMKAVQGFDIRHDGVNVVHAMLPDTVGQPQIFGVTEEKGRALPATPGRAVLGVSDSESNA